MNSMREDLDTTMAGVVLSEEKRKAILEAMEKGEKPVKKVIRPIIVFAAVLALLTVSAFAVTFQDLLVEALGNFLPISQSVEDASVTDQGLEAKIVSAVTDSVTTKIYVTVQDKTGDRLKSTDIRMRYGISRPNTEETISTMGAKCVSYDAETRTALFELNHSGSLPTTGEDPLFLAIGEIQPEEFNFWLPLPQELLTNQILKTRELDTGETVLVPGQTPHTFEGVDYLTLSSMGFAADGRIHFLVKLSEQAARWTDDPAILTTLFSDIPGEILGGEDIRTLDFNLDGQQYYEVSFPLTTDAFDRLRLDDIYGVITNQSAIEGAWRLKVNLEQLPCSRYEIDGIIDHVTYHQLLLSPLSVVMKGGTEDEPHRLMQTYQVAVVLKDGTVLHPEYSGGMWNSEAEGDKGTNRWEFADPVETAQVAGIAFNYWMIPINGAVAGPGYWLAEMP